MLFITIYDIINCFTDQLEKGRKLIETEIKHVSYTRKKEMKKRTSRKKLIEIVRKHLFRELDIHKTQLPIFHIFKLIK